MEPESLVQLVGSGNAATVEKEWMAIVESPGVKLAHLRQYDVLFSAIRKRGNVSFAADLAWAAIETLSSRFEPIDTLTVAGPFLLAVGNGDELRTQVTALYRAAYAGREGLEELLTEAGLPVGRPVRRALRTLDVCLAVSVGDFLKARHGAAAETHLRTAAKIVQIDAPSCEYVIDTGESSATFGAVELADAYYPAPESDFWVMRQFHRDELERKLQKDPASVVIEICRQNNNSIDSDELEKLLADDLLPDAGWKQWWMRARTALKKCPNIELEGRSPYFIHYHDRPIAMEDAFLGDFRRLRDPLDQLKLIDGYLRDCKLRNAEPSEDALRHCYDSFVERLERAAAQSFTRAVCLAAAAGRVGSLAGFDGAANRLGDLLRDADDMEQAFGQLGSDELLETACDALVTARPDDWQAHLIELLPKFPLATCDRVAQRLAVAGRTQDEFERIVQRIVSSPVKHYEALLWLWDGPRCDLVSCCMLPVNILTRILRMLEDVRISGKLSRDRERMLRTRVRTVLSARKYERLVRCLDGIDTGVMRALRMQVSRAEGLAFSVRGGMLKEIDRRLPVVAEGAVEEPWERQDVLFVTESGLRRKQNEIEHHVNVTMAKNAKAIGRAAERGDLSENSEYKFALEERDLLRARLAQMNKEMAKATIFRPEEVPTDQVGIGSRVVFRRVEDGLNYTMMFAGPWEAKIEEGWFNYQSPLAQSLMGKTVSEVVEFDHTGAIGRYEIVALDSIFSTDDSGAPLPMQDANSEHRSAPSA